MKPIARKILIDQIKAIVESFDSNEIDSTLDEIYEIQKQKNDGLNIVTGKQIGRAHV